MVKKTKKLYEYPHITPEGKISFISNTETREINNDHFYIDRHFYGAGVADPCKATLYTLHNIYMIEEGNIYIAGFMAKSQTGPNPKINCWLCFDDIDKYIASEDKVKFNPNHFSQETSFETLWALNGDKNIILNHMAGMTPYDAPITTIQRAMFLAGVKAAYKYKPDYNGIVEIRKEFKSEFYFALEEFYLSGIDRGCRYQLEIYAEKARVNA